jgi:hypothetical protein
VPHALLRETVWVRITARTIEVLHRGQRIAAHKRVRASLTGSGTKGEKGIWNRIWNRKDTMCLVRLGGFEPPNSYSQPAPIAVDTVVAVKCLFLIRLELLGPTLLGMKACWSPWDGRQARAARARPILGCGA